MSDEIKRYNRFIKSIMPSFGSFDVADKEMNVGYYVSYMLNRLQSMFKWDGLPDNIPQRTLELYLMINGNACFYHYDGKLYVFTGGMGGKLNQYYMPTIYTISNPYLNLTVMAEIDKDCIVIPNDTLYVGMLPLCTKYATQMCETDISIRLSLINSRMTQLISAPDDRTKASADKFLDDIDKGKQGVISSSAFFGGIQTQPYAATGTHTLTDLIEMMQYFKASFFNEIGLNANYNMKRESLNSAESQLNNDALLPLVDDMLKQRQIGAEKVNSMFGTNISVSFNSSWEDNEIEIEQEQQTISERPENNADGG